MMHQLIHSLVLVFVCTHCPFAVGPIAANAADRHSALFAASLPQPHSAHNDNPSASNAIHTTGHLESAPSDRPVFKAEHSPSSPLGPRFRLDWASSLSLDITEPTTLFLHSPVIASSLAHYSFILSGTASLPSFSALVYPERSLLEDPDGLIPQRTIIQGLAFNTSLYIAANTDIIIIRLDVVSPASLSLSIRIARPSQTTALAVPMSLPVALDSRLDSYEEYYPAIVSQIDKEVSALLSLPRGLVTQAWPSQAPTIWVLLLPSWILPIELSLPLPSDLSGAEVLAALITAMNRGNSGYDPALFPLLSASNLSDSVWNDTHSVTVYRNSGCPTSTNTIDTIDTYTLSNACSVESNSVVNGPFIRFGRRRDEDWDIDPDKVIKAVSALFGTMILICCLCCCFFSSSFFRPNRNQRPQGAVFEDEDPPIEGAPPAAAAAQPPTAPSAAVVRGPAQRPIPIGPLPPRRPIARGDRVPPRGGRGGRPVPPGSGPRRPNNRPNSARPTIAVMPVMSGESAASGPRPPNNRVLSARPTIAVMPYHSDSAPEQEDAYQPGSVSPSVRTIQNSGPIAVSTQHSDRDISIQSSRQSQALLPSSIELSDILVSREDPPGSAATHGSESLQDAHRSAASGPHPLPLGDTSSPYDDDVVPGEDNSV